MHGDAFGMICMKVRLGWGLDLILVAAAWPAALLLCFGCCIPVFDSAVSFDLLADPYSCVR
jgi:hypothetical protein